MRYQKPYIATLDEVTITREGDTAIIAYKKKYIGTTHLKIGDEIIKMSDQDILNCHNSCIQAQMELAKSYKHVATEIPPGESQIEYFEPGGYWTPRGQVLRCIIDDGGEDFEATIWVDDKEFTMKEFGRLLSAFTGWGMRIIIVPDDETHVTPPIEIKDPGETQSDSIALMEELSSKSEH